MPNRLHQAILVVAFLAISLAGCGGKVQSRFVADCRAGGAPKEFCVCVYGGLVDHYGRDVIEDAVTRAIVPSDYLERVTIAGATCRGIEVPGDAAILGEPFVSPSAAAEPVATVDLPVADDSLISQAIQITASAVSGEEYRDGRLSASGDIDGDGRDDAAVVFTIEVASANTATQNLAVFVRQGDGGLRFAGSTVVGGTVGTRVGRLSIDQGVVVLTTLTHGPDDSDCCPSIEGSARFELSGGALRQVQ